MFEDGKKVFYRAVGLVTRKQLATTRVQRLILGNGAHERVRRAQQQPPVHRPLPSASKAGRAVTGGTPTTAAFTSPGGFDAYYADLTQACF
ncbi:unnamed protein product [Macrosiphum euphorbiae]|uniref:Uncharacterized protein n=1 Tax=Macrosiphum euphorbiae TaxID=13131 RepID=A0AAV0WPF8_9HEMI|nr:unnamed protein product [Macrosiphum euphorbiae]